MSIVEVRPGRWATILTWAAAVAALAMPVPALAADETKAAISGCRAETASRLRLDASDVTVARDEEGPRRGADRPLNWFTSRGDRGTCSYQHGQVTAWNADHTAPRRDDETLCVAAVARLVRKRPQDIEILEVEKNTQTSSTVQWSTYQGETGTCTVAEGRIKRVDRE